LVLAGARPGPGVQKQVLLWTTFSESKFSITSAPARQGSDRRHMSRPQERVAVRGRPGTPPGESTGCVGRLRPGSHRRGVVGGRAPRCHRSPGPRPRLARPGEWAPGARTIPARRPKHGVAPWGGELTALGDGHHQAPRRPEDVIEALSQGGRPRADADLDVSYRSRAGRHVDARARGRRTRSPRPRPPLDVASRGAHTSRQRVHHLAAGDPAPQLLAIGGEHGQTDPPIEGQLPERLLQRLVGEQRFVVGGCQSRCRRAPTTVPAPPARLGVRPPVDRPPGARRRPWPRAASRPRP